jgi:hypothetical protein
MVWRPIKATRRAYEKESQMSEKGIPGSEGTRFNDVEIDRKEYDFDGGISGVGLTPKIENYRITGCVRRSTICGSSQILGVVITLH